VARLNAPRALLAVSIALVAVAGIVGVLTLSPAHSADSPAGPSPSCVPPHLNVSAALAEERVTVSPAPETRDASATTQISMLGVPAGELTNVSVSGSRSGAHAGRLLAYSQGDGASFVPSHPFDGGELVSVHAELHEGARVIPFAWSFTVAVRDDPGVHSNAVGTGTAKSTTTPAAPKEYQSFHSRPELRPPDVTVSSEDRSATGDLFLAPYSGIGQYGPMILGEHGQLVWFKPLGPPGTRAANFQVQQYEGKPVLTWWQDPLIVGSVHTSGEVIANSSYQTIHVVRAGNGYQPDLHEFLITPQGTGLITVYDAIECNLSSVGGPANGAVADTLVQEIDLKTGLVMYEWHSLDHVPLSNSYSSAAPTSRAEPFDYFHINSINLGGVGSNQSGEILIDSRNTWAAYDTSAKTGRVLWELGGKRSSFKLAPGAATAWQHDAVLQPNGNITFFDNGAFPQVHPQSRAIELALDTHTMTATLARSYAHHNPLVAGSQGNLQVLANGDWMVGWGQAGYLSEVAPSGQVLFNAHLPPDWESYRTFVLPWSAHPTQPPAIAAEASPQGKLPAGASVYASWNGATEVSSWQVIAGSTPSALKPTGSAVAKSGFETTIAVPGLAAGSYVAVQALGANGSVIGTSPTVAVKAGA
jgi:hypothetical protein